jgi:hypothetical protein
VTQYTLPGGIYYQQQVYPNPAELNPNTLLKTYEQVITHFTNSSLFEDGIAIVGGTVQVVAEANGYTVSFTPQAGFESQAAQFAQMHMAMLDENHAGLALTGAAACQLTPAWNPMAGYPVNASDGPSRWLPCMPLGMPIANHRAVTLLHYPPIVALENANYLNNMTLRRWAQVLTCVGIAQPTLYHAILDVNPIAAPGSGESEYPNDYFPINLTSLFFDNDQVGLTYVRSMLELMLNPPANAANPYTLPLLVGGSPLYDPQAPGWFRTRYKDQLPKDKNGSPTANVLQAGFIQLNPGSAKKTPYMIANHMIAAGVTGVCTGNPAKTPFIQVYEAQDLAAATFLSLYAAQPGIDPTDAAKQACLRWFGNEAGVGPVNPASKDDQLTICALAQMDLCFDPVKIAPMYTFAQAQQRCQQMGGSNFAPCFGCAPIPPSGAAG